MLIYFLIIGVLNAVNAAEHDVLALGDNDFATTIQDHETTLVMFYAPWCGHCKKIKPEYAKAAELVKDDDTPIHFVKVDCTEEGKATCNKYSVTGYPTLKIFKKGEMSQDYNGPREAAGIVKYMRSQVGPASKDILSVAEFNKYLDSKETTIFGFFEKESELKKTFTKYADKMRMKHRFGHTSSADVLAKQGENNAVIIFRPSYLHNKLEPSFVKFEGTTGELGDFVAANLHGLVGLRSRESLQDFKNPLIVAYYAVDYIKNPKGTNYWRNRVLKVAKEFEGKLGFAISAKDDFQHELNEYGYDFVGDKPTILARDAKNQKFALKEEFSVESLREFAANLLAGSLEPYVKSEPIPTSNDAPVKVAVSKNFEELVNNNDKDTLIEFYAPWCGHCKKLTPIFEEVAELLKDEDVSLVKMDATANDVPPTFDVKGFPTIYWLPKDSKDKPITYDAGRDVNDFIKYISKRATKELKNYDRSGNPKKTEL